MADINDPNENNKKKEPLASVVQRGQQKIAEAASSGNPEQPLDSAAAQHYMDQLAQLNAQYAPTAAPQSKQALSDAIEKANQLYKDQANKNEWLEVAQLLGRAGAQFAGAQAGMSNGGHYGRNMAGLDSGPGIDYGARTERAAKDREHAVRSAQDMSEAERKDIEDENKQKALKFTGAREANEKGLQAALREEEIRRQESGDEKRLGRSLKAEDDRSSREIQRQNLRDLEISEKDTRGKLAAAMTLAGSQDIADDLSSRDASKLQAKYGDMAGKAGIDLNAVSKEAEQIPETDKSFLGIGYKGKDPEAGHKALMAHVQKIKDELAQIRARKQNILSGNSSSPEASATTAPEEKIRVRQKASGQTGTINAADFDPTKYERI